MIRLNAMRFLDRYAGGTLCGILDFYERVKRPFTRLRCRTADPGDGPIFVMKLWGLGSVILSKPALMALRRRYPDTKILYVTFVENERMVRALEMVDDVLTIRRGTLLEFCVDTIGAIRHLRRLGARVGIDFEFVSCYTAILMYASGARRRVGFFLPRMYRGAYLLTDRVYYSMYKHTAESFLELARRAGADGVGLQDFLAVPLLRVREEWIKSLGERLRECGVEPGARLVGVNANAGEIGIERRRWPAEYFVKLIRGLSLQHPEVCVLLTGGRGEAPYVEEINSRVGRPNVISVAGRLSLEEMIACVSKMTMLITNDSGPLHIAVAVGTRTVCLFGPESPVLYGPLGEGHVLLYKGCYCSPCHNMFNAKRYQCPDDNKCLREIHPDEVLRAVERQLALAKPGAR